HYGFSRAEFLTMRVSDVQADGDTDIPGEPRLGGLKQHRLKDGQVIDVEISSHIFQFAGRKVALLSARDITQAKRAEEALRRSEARYRPLIQGAPYGIYRATADGCFVDVNPALAKMLGYDAEAELLEINLATGVYQLPEEHDRLRAEFRQRERVEGVEV